MAEEGSIGYAVFDTAIGACAIVWSARGVCGFHLPHVDSSRGRARVSQRHAGAREAEPPPSVQQAIDGVVALLQGEPVDLTGVPLDLSGVPDFHRRVYEVARSIPPGRTLSYGEVAERLGDPQLARSVGQALGANPIAVIVPCHRVLAAGGRAGGFSAPGGIDTKRRLLEIERARVGAEPGLFD
jgi:methylated-DNA-[protein]-cysteine S-methyltransferase